MNASKALFATIAPAVIALASSIALASDEPAATPALPEVSRAEVIAEMILWRESGLADLQSGDKAIDTTEPGYAEAQQRFQAMKASPRFAQLVERIQRQRGEKERIAAQR
jgi:hypothetical protein